MRLDRTLHIYKKEMLETVRDRRTLIVMLVVPVGAGQVSEEIQQAGRKTIHRDAPKGLHRACLFA